MSIERKKRVAKLYELNGILKKSSLRNKFAQSNSEPSEKDVIDEVNKLQGGPNYPGRGTSFSFNNNDHIFRATYNSNIWPTIPGNKITFNFISSFAEDQQKYLVNNAKLLVEQAAKRLTPAPVKFIKQLSAGWNPGGEGGYWLHLLYIFGSKTHTVEPGQNLTRIAEMYSVTPEEIAELNNISNPSLIRPGQILNIP